MLFYVASYVVLILVSCAWLFHVIRNMYPIILPGLKSLFMTFVAHSCFMYFQLLHVLIRPAWQLNMASYFWDNKVLCHIYARLGTLFGTFSVFLATLFGFFKLRVYVQFLGKANCVRMQMRMLSFFLLVWVAFCILSVILTSSERRITDGVKMCFRYPDQWLITTLTLHWFFINAYIVCFCIVKRNSLETFPNISHQMRLNLFIIPLIFVTTFITRLIGVYYELQFSNKHVALFLRVMPVALDNLFNNVVMYWFLYGNAKLDFLSSPETEAVSLQRRFAISKSRSRTPMNTPERHWVSLTGMHPVSMTLEEIFENDLQSLMVPISMRKRQIAMFKNSWANVELSKSISRPLDSHDDREPPKVYKVRYSTSRGASQSEHFDSISTYSERRFEYEQKKEKKMNCERRKKTVLRLQSFLDRGRRDVLYPEVQLPSHSGTVEN